MNEHLGNRLWGASFILYFIFCLDNICNTALYSRWAGILSVIVLLYFITFGTSRFTKEYKKLI